MTKKYKKFLVIGILVFTSLFVVSPLIRTYIIPSSKTFIMEHETGAQYLASSPYYDLMQVKKDGTIQVYQNGNIKTYNAKKPLIDIKQYYYEGNSRHLLNGYYRQILIYDNDDVYVNQTINKDDSQTFMDEGILISTIPNAVQADIGIDHATVVTEDGKLYVYGKNDVGQLGMPNVDETGKFILNQQISDVKKAVCGYDYTFVLTKAGEVYYCGNFSYNGEIFKKEFVKLDVPSFVIDIDAIRASSGARGAVALCQSGELCEIGRERFGFGTMFFVEFDKIPQFSSPIEKFSVTEGKGVGVNKKKNLQIRATRSEGKADGLKYDKKVLGISGVEDAYYSQNGLFVLKDNKIYLLEFEHAKGNI